MFNTKELTDKIVMFLACFFIYLAQSVFVVNVVPVIITIVVSCLLSYLENEKVKALLNASYLILCLYIPVLIVFMPLFFYDVFFKKYQVLMVVMIISIALTLSKTGLMLTGNIIALIIVGLVLKNRTMKFAELKNNYTKIADDTREMSEVLKAQNKDLSEKADNDINVATLKERNRIAREIHDNVGHQLSSAILQIGALLTTNKEATLNENLLSINKTLSLAMTSIRESVHNLHDQSVDLHMQIEALLVNFSFCEVIFEDQLTSHPEKMLKTTFISITKEALSNVIKHSNASQVHILLREHPAFYQLIIRDNGTSKITTKETGMGLMNMSDRIHAYKGNINFRKENGFEIFISVPKEELCLKY